MPSPRAIVIGIVVVFYGMLVLITLAAIAHDLIVARRRRPRRPNIYMRPDPQELLSLGRDPEGE